MDADALRSALIGAPDDDATDDGDDPVTVAGQALAKKLDLDEEGLDLLDAFIAARLAAEGR